MHALGRTVLTLLFLWWTRRCMLGDMSSSRASCSHSFLRRRSSTLGPLLALWKDTRAPETFTRPSRGGAGAQTYLLLLEVAADVGDLDLQGVQLFVWYLRNGEGLHLLRTLEAELRQGDAPLTVVLLVLPGGTRTDTDTGRQLDGRHGGGHQGDKLLLSLTLQFVS